MKVQQKDVVVALVLLFALIKCLFVFVQSHVIIVTAALCLYVSSQRLS